MLLAAAFSIVPNESHKLIRLLRYADVVCVCVCGVERSRGVEQVRGEAGEDRGCPMMLSCDSCLGN